MLRFSEITKGVNASLYSWLRPRLVLFFAFATACCLCGINAESKSGFRVEPRFMEYGDNKRVIQLAPHGMLAGGTGPANLDSAQRAHPAGGALVAAASLDHLCRLERRILDDGQVGRVDAAIWRKALASKHLGRIREQATKEPRRAAWKRQLPCLQPRSCRSLPSGGIRRNVENATFKPARWGVQAIGPTR